MRTNPRDIIKILLFMKVNSLAKIHLVKVTEATVPAQKMKFFIKDFFSKSDHIRSFLRIWSNLLRKYFMENFI